MKNFGNLRIKALKCVALVVLMALTLTSCGDKPKGTAETYIISNFTNNPGVGEFFTDSIARLYFCDFSSMNTAVICPNPNCSHTNEKSCSSYGMGNHPILLGQSIYFFDVEFVLSDDGASENMIIYKANTDGTNRSVVHTEKGISLAWYSRMVVHNNTAYFPAEEREFDEYGNSTGFETAYLCSFDLSSGKFKKITEIYHGYHGGCYIYGIYNDKIYMDVVASDIKIDYSDLDAIIKDEESEDSEDSEDSYMCYNIPEGEFVKSDIPNFIFVNEEYFIYCNEGTTTILDKNGDIALEIDIDTTYSILTVVNGKFFLEHDGVCYDIESKKKYKLNNSGCEIISYFNGQYILRYPNESDNVAYSYKAMSESELIGDEIK